MKTVNEDQIKQRAYEIWDKGGRPHGLDREHWDQAARELMNGDATPKAIKAKIAPRAAKPRIAAAAVTPKLVVSKPAAAKPKK
jgi:hypothetical protein